MKFNFKKVASVIATTAMLGSTLAFATAALSLPASDYAVVYGADLDSAAAVDMAAALTSTATSTVTGDNVQLAKENDKFNLGDNWNAFYSSMDEEELAVVLAEGTYLNDDNNDYEYDQKIEMGSQLLTFFQDNEFNDEKPIVGFTIPRSTRLMNYTLDFVDAAEGGDTVSGDEFPKIDNTEINMLGKNFFISDVEMSGANVQITLLDTANSAIMAEDEEKTVTVGGKSYKVSVTFIEDDQVKLNVDGTDTNILATGETYDIGDGLYVGIKDIMFNSKESKNSKVEFSLGMGEVVLENTKEVKLNDEDISTIKDANGYKSEIVAYIANTSTKIERIALTWNTDSEVFIAPGTELTMPGFEAIKLSMTGFTAPKSEVTKLEDSSDSLTISTEIKDGAIDLPILHSNDTQTGFDVVGEDTDHKLLTGDGNAITTGSYTLALNTTFDNYFVITYINGDDGESYAFEISDIDSDNKTVLDNLAGGSDVTLSEVTDSEDVGNVRLKLQNVDPIQETAFVNVTRIGTAGTVYLNKLVTKEGLTMRLPVDNATIGTAMGQGVLNTTNNPATWDMNITEEDDNDNIDYAAASFTISLGNDAGDGTEPTTTSLTTYDEEKGSDWEVGMKTSSLATKVRIYKPSDGLGSAEITYAGSESYADVYVSEAGSVTSSSSTSAPVMVSAMTAADKAKNLIVIGGSCINTVAAKLITGLETPLCGAEFTAKTTVGAGQYMIKGYESPYTTGKIAVLVAGYEAQQTVDAVKAAKEMDSLTKTTDVVAPKLV